MESIGAYVKHLRLVHEPSWSLQDVSDACGLSKSHLSQIERDEINPSLKSLEAIALVYGRRAGDLLTEAGYTVNKSRTMRCTAKIIVECVDGDLSFVKVE